MPRAAAPVGAPKVPAGSVEHRERLIALRDLLTAAVAEAGARELAPLAGQLRAVLSELAGIPDVSKVSDVDDLAGQRARRRASAAG